MEETMKCIDKHDPNKPEIIRYETDMKPSEAYFI